MIIQVWITATGYATILSVCTLWMLRICSLHPPSYMLSYTPSHTPSNLPYHTSSHTSSHTPSHLPRYSMARYLGNVYISNQHTDSVLRFRVNTWEPMELPSSLMLKSRIDYWSGTFVQFGLPVHTKGKLELISTVSTFVYMCFPFSNQDLIFFQQDKRVYGHWHMWVTKYGSLMKQ